MSREILETIIDSFNELKQTLLHEFQIDLDTYEVDDFEEDEDLIDSLTALSDLNEIAERYN